MKVLFPDKLDDFHLLQTRTVKNAATTTNQVESGDIFYILDELESRVGVTDSGDADSLTYKINAAVSLIENMQAAENTFTSPLLETNNVVTLKGLSTLGAANQIIGSNSGATALEYKTFSGTTNQITLSHAANSLTFSTPQDIATTSSPTFLGLTLTAGTQTSNTPVLNITETVNNAGVNFQGIKYALTNTASSSFRFLDFYTGGSRVFDIQAGGTITTTAGIFATTTSNIGGVGFSSVAGISGVDTISFSGLNRSISNLYDLTIADRKSTRLNSSHVSESRMPSSA